MIDTGLNQGTDCSEGASGKDEQRKDMKHNSCLFEDPPLAATMLVALPRFSQFLWGNFIQLQITDEET